ncbi:MAG: FKBP-type peptidyl-prolyl cis-trans isomerase [Myxococcota bacterium]|nr:FKBP-type peptidyl-prolyl cis-trans isomerase [Myxococcota bacterium]
MSTIQKNMVGIFLYKLTNSAGELLDDSGHEPMAYLHGYENIVPGLENAMEGREAGESFRVALTPRDGYGEYIDSEPMPVHQKEFGLEYFRELQEGQPIPLQNPDGDRVVLYVLRKEDSYAYLTRNHPLAGQTLIFDIEIVRVRDALPEEITRGYPHRIDEIQGNL